MNDHGFTVDASTLRAMIEANVKTLELNTGDAGDAE